MKIVLKVAQFNGASNAEKYDSVKEAQKYLNEVLYYSNGVELSASFSNIEAYINKTSLAKLMREAITYGDGFINVYVNY